MPSSQWTASSVSVTSIIRVLRAIDASPSRWPEITTVQGLCSRSPSILTSPTRPRAPRCASNSGTRSSQPIHGLDHRGRYGSRRPGLRRGRGFRLPRQSNPGTGLPPGDRVEAPAPPPGRADIHDKPTAPCRSPASHRTALRTRHYASRVRSTDPPLRPSPGRPRPWSGRQTPTEVDHWRRSTPGHSSSSEP